MTDNKQRAGLFVLEGLSRLGNKSSRLGERLVDYINGQVDYMTIVCVFKAFNTNSNKYYKTLP